MSRVRRFTLTSVAIAALFAGPAAFAIPASATTLDASGVALDFSNPVNTDYLENATAGDSQLYSGVATIGGSVVDALVTFVGASSSSVGEDFIYFDQSQVDLINGLLGAPGNLTPGCYSNVGYLTNPPGYDYSGFALGDRLAGGSVMYVDGYDRKAAYNSTISSSVHICPDAGGENGDITVRVDFQVAGEPVTLNNLTLNVTDLDNQQEMTLSSPKPTSWVIDSASLVTVSEAEADVLTLVGSTDPSPETAPYFPERYTAEAHYDAVSSVTYSFKIVNASSGGVEVAFDSYFPSTVPEATLAETGVETLPAGILVLGAVVLGAAFVVARRVRRSRA